MFGSAGHCPALPELALEFKIAPQKPPTRHCPAPPLPDIVWILNLSPTASFLGELYKYTSTFNISPLSATAFFC
jgi:hypothetical protein